MKRKYSSYLTLALAVMLSIPAGESVVEGAKRLRRGCHRIYVSSPESTQRVRRRPTFSAAEILDLRLEVLVPRKLTGRHHLELKVYTPKGNLYQSMSLPFDADAPIPEGAPRRSRRYQTVSTTLPVAGTSIVSSSLYGRWKVEAFLDGGDQRCTSPRRFVIKP